MRRPSGYFFPTLVPKNPELTTANGFFFNFRNTVHCMVMQIKLVVVFVCADCAGTPGPVDLANIKTSVKFSVGYVQKNLRDCLQFS